MLNLDELIGLEHVKKQIKEHIDYIEFLKLRKEKGLQDNERISLHSVFTGNPGTGKTTVVKLLGKIYQKMGLLSKGHVHEVDRSDLVGEFIGQTAPKVRENIEKARGGILFIDEAYALVRSKEDSKDYGREVIEVLIKEMSDGPGDIAIMAAGYPKEMQLFTDFNPGLKSRFKYYFHFEDYTPDELIAIADYAAEKRLVKVNPDAKEYINKLLINAYRDRDHTFGNARYAYAIIDEAKMNLGLRLIKNPKCKKSFRVKLYPPLHLMMLKTSNLPRLKKKLTFL
ncbi:MAG: AAA family ATPase [Chloroflexia bacterium]|nr:AAA family ATPase [Chloroflexia bacterium]